VALGLRPLRYWRAARIPVSTTLTTTVSRARLLHRLPHGQLRVVPADRRRLTSGGSSATTGDDLELVGSRDHAQALHGPKADAGRLQCRTPRWTLGRSCAQVARREKRPATSSRRRARRRVPHRTTSSCRRAGCRHSSAFIRERQSTSGHRCWHPQAANKPPLSSLGRNELLRIGEQTPAFATEQN
jgi:hypothetical protein